MSRPHARPPSRSRRAAVVVAAAATDGVGVGKVSLFVNGRLAGVRYAQPYGFTWAPARPGRYRLEVRAADAAGNVGHVVTTVAAVHPRRGEARTPSGWVFTRVRAETRSIASAADAAPSRSTRGSAPLKSMTVDGDAGQLAGVDDRGDALEELGRDLLDPSRRRPAGQVRARCDDAPDLREDALRRLGQLRDAHADRVAGSSPVIQR